uniref:Uncharacterized protein n=1 Tax=Anopheles farauti TaxID=69004 RepID=A0A182QII6_9DIPT
MYPDKCDAVGVVDDDEVLLGDRRCKSSKDCINSSTSKFSSADAIADRPRLAGVAGAVEAALEADRRSPKLETAVVVVGDINRPKFASSFSYLRKTANESVFESGISLPAGLFGSLISSLRFFRTVLESRSFGFASAIWSALKVDLIGSSSYSEDLRKLGDTGPSSVMPFCMLDFAFSTYIGRDTLRGIRKEYARRKFELWCEFLFAFVALSLAVPPLGLVWLSRDVLVVLPGELACIKDVMPVCLASEAGANFLKQMGHGSNSRFGGGSSLTVANVELPFPGEPQ